MKTESFEFNLKPRTSFESLKPREAIVHEAISLKSAGKFYFSEPNWRVFEGDEAVVVGRGDWALARLQELVKDNVAEFSLSEVGSEMGERFCVLFEVREKEVFAEIGLFIAKKECGWIGQADSHAKGVEACEEIMKLMLDDPECVAKCVIDVPGRRTPVGWTGRRFKQQRKVKRPAYLSKESIEQRASSMSPVSFKTMNRRQNNAPRIFRVNTLPIFADPESVRSRLRFTDGYPPPEILSARPNWEAALSEEGSFGQDESTIKPSANQKHIGQQIVLTAGEVWFSNDEVFVALACTNAKSLVIYIDDDSVITFSCWAVSDDVEVRTQLTNEQRMWFPIRFYSDLPFDPRRPESTLRFEVDATGRCREIDCPS